LLDEFLIGKPAGQARLLRLYATWYVLRRMRTRAARETIIYSQAVRARSYVRRAADLLQWLDEHGKELTSLRQSDLDQWLAGTSLDRHISPFLTWAHDRRLIGDVRAPRREASEPGDAIDSDVHWNAISDLLHDDRTPLELRVAGLFVLLFGQQLTRITQLTVDHVHCGPVSVEVRFGKTLIVLPPLLDDLVRDLLHVRGHSSLPTSQSRTWLFPGAAPGRPLTAGNLGRRLRELDLIPVIRTARNAAMLHLAAEIPTPLLAELIGISPGRAASWANLAKRNWIGYLAHKADHPPPRDETDEHIE
jgi:hypothetical protein